MCSNECWGAKNNESNTEQRKIKELCTECFNEITQPYNTAKRILTPLFVLFYHSTSFLEPKKKCGYESKRVLDNELRASMPNPHFFVNICTINNLGNLWFVANRLGFEDFVKESHCNQEWFDFKHIRLPRLLLTNESCRWRYQIIAIASNWIYSDFVLIFILLPSNCGTKQNTRNSIPFNPKNHSSGRFRWKKKRERKEWEKVFQLFFVALPSQFIRYIFNRTFLNKFYFDENSFPQWKYEKRCESFLCGFISVITFSAVNGA